MLTAGKSSKKSDVADPGVDSDFGCSQISLDYERLQKQNRFPFPRLSVKKIAINLFAVVIALAACEMLTRVLVSITKPAQFGHKAFDAKFAVASQDTPPATPCLFFLGASFTNRAVYPELIERSLAKRGVNIAVKNLACNSTHPAGALFLLKEALRHSSGPTVVVYDVEPPIVPFTEERAKREREIWAPYIADSYMGQCMNSTWPVFKEVDLYLNQHFYCVRYRSLIKSTLLDFTKNLTLPEKALLDPGVEMTESECSTRGWSPGYEFIPGEEYWKNREKRPSPFGDLTEGYDLESLKNPRYRYLNDLRQFCNEKHIPLVLLWLPVHSRASERYGKELGLTDPQMQDMMFRVAANESSVLIDAHDLNDEDNFYNGSHVNSIGGIAVSKRIAEDLLSDRFKGVLNHLQEPSRNLTKE